MTIPVPRWERLPKWQKKRSCMLLIETTRPLLDDSRVPNTLETVSIEYIHSLEKEKNGGK